MRLVIAISAFAILLTACNFFDAEDAVRTTPPPAQIEQETPVVEATAHISNVPSTTLRLDPDKSPSQPRLSSTPTGPTQLTQADQSLAEQKRWCEEWALDNLDPLIYVAFLELDPLNMDDIARTVWRDRLRSNSCSMYGSEPLNETNADRRNVQYKAECLGHLANAAGKEWLHLGKLALEEGLPVAYDIPNQYVKALLWVHLTGDQLLALDERPYQLLERLAHVEYANWEQWPYDDYVEQSRSQYGDEFDIEHWSLIHKAVRHDCQQYYPQVFTGRWIPTALHPDDKVIEVRPELTAAVKHVLEGPLYLPRP